jgi:hypothetical protein
MAIPVRRLRFTHDGWGEAVFEVVVQRPQRRPAYVGPAPNCEALRR